MKKMLALALVLAAAPVAAFAGPMSYTYVEGGYNRLHLDGGDFYDDTTADGAYVRGSYDFGTSGVNVFASVGKVSDTYQSNGLRVDADVRQDELGLGYHQSMSERVDFIAEGAWVRQVADAEASFAGNRASDSMIVHGGRVAVGVRGQFNDIVEGLAKVNYYGGGDFEDDAFTVTAGAQFKINPTWGITAEIENGKIEDVQTTRYMVGVRASF